MVVVAVALVLVVVVVVAVVVVLVVVVFLTSVSKHDMESYLMFSSVFDSQRNLGLRCRISLPFFYLN